MAVAKKRSRVIFWAGICLLIALAVTAALFPFGGEGWRSVFRRLGLAASPPEGETVTFFDVGQGAAACLSGEDQICLIDCGGPAWGEVVADGVRALGGRQVDLLLVTHPHDDHIGGLPALLRRLPVKRIAMADWAPEGAEDAAALRALDEACRAAGCERLTLREGDVFTVAGFTVETLFARDAEQENDRCAVFRASAEGRRVLFLGDMSKQAEWRMLAAGVDLTCDLLAVGHHGSGSATSQELLDAAGPALAVISCGADNPYGHPADATLERLRAAGVTRLRTDCNGSVRIALPDLTAV
ncbi:MAG: MBL fold metallo-hydrolase, partial [Clostridia bacterium]|nr:MBL fold metallo-hydrolase [Clostridia bacterium]